MGVQSRSFQAAFYRVEYGPNRDTPAQTGRQEESIRQMMAACEKTLAQGCSVFFFPEGTRSKTGQTKPFKPGAFILAHKMKLPILVVAISGTQKALPKHSLTIHGRHAIRIEVLEEIPYESYSHLSVEQTAEEVRQRIAAHVG